MDRLGVGLTVLGWWMARRTVKREFEAAAEIAPVTQRDIEAWEEKKSSSAGA